MKAVIFCKGVIQFGFSLLFVTQSGDYMEILLSLHSVT